MRRANTDTTHHLKWFFTEAQGAVSGLRSSYWTLVEMAQSGAARQAGSGSSRTPSPRALSAASREADLAARLEQLTVDQRIALSLAFGPSPWPVVGAFEQREDRVRLGEHPGVALVSERAHRAFTGTVKKRVKRVGEDERRVVVTVVGCGEDRMTSAHRMGPDPRAGVRAMLDRGFVAFLRGPSLSDVVLKEIREDIAATVTATVIAWDAVAPRPDHDGKVRHDRHRRAAYGPAQASEDGDRVSGVYPVVRLQPTSAAASWTKAG